MTRPALARAVLVAAIIATLADSPPETYFSAETESAFDVAFPAEGPARHRFELTVTHEAFADATDVEVELSVEGAPGDLLVLRAQHTRGGEVREERGSLALSVLLGRPVVVEVERLAGSSSVVTLRAKMERGIWVGYEGEEPPPPPAWTEADFELAVEERPTPRDALNGSLPPDTLRLRATPVAYGGYCSPAFDPAAQDDATLTRAPSVETPGPYHPGDRIVLRTPFIESFVRVFIEGFDQGRTTRVGLVEVTVPPVAGSVDVVVRFEDQLAVLEDALWVEPAALPTPTDGPGGGYIDAVGDGDRVWLATRDAVFLQPPGEPPRVVRRFDGAVRRLGVAGEAVWVLTDRRVYRQTPGDWLAPALDMDAHQLVGRWFRDAVIVGSPTVVMNTGERDGPFRARAVDVDPCDPHDLLALDDAGALWRSEDFGKGWLRLLGPPGVGFTELARTPEEPRTAFLAHATGSVTGRFHDPAETWADGPPITRFAFDPRVGLFGAGPTGLWSRRDRAWHPVATWDRTQVLGLEVDDRQVRVLTVDGVIRIGP